MSLMSQKPQNFSWMTCINGVLGANIGSGASSTRYLQVSDLVLPSGLPVIQMAFDCYVVAMAVTYLEAAGTPLVIDSGTLQFRCGEIPIGSASVSASFSPFRAPRELPATTPVLEWGTELNGTHPTTMRSDLGIFLKAGTLFTVQSLETGVISAGSSNAEVSCSIWIASNTPVEDLSGLK